MPIQSTDSTSTITFSADNQSWTIKSGVVVAPDGSQAVEMDHADGFLFNYGDLTGDASNGSDGVIASTSASNGFIFNELGASISGDTAILDYANNDRISNLGTIQGTVNGILSEGSSLRVYNSGYLFGGTNGIEPGGGGATINNSGTIEAGSVGLFLSSSTATVVHNSGSLTGYSESILASSTSTLYLTNTGSIHGTILLGDASDSIVNSGTIDGDIYLGNGSNSFTETGSGGVTDAINGGGGTDAFSFSVASFAAGVTLNAGAGSDFLQFSTAGTVSADALANVTGVETITLANGTNNISLPDALATSASGHILTVTGGSGRDTIDDSDVTTATDRVILRGGGGADTLTAGGGVDWFTYGGASDSTSTHYDTVSDFNFVKDRFNTPGAVGTITVIDAAVTTGALSTATFDANLNSALRGHLGAHHAELFTPNSGTLSGQTFLVADLNGAAGYQANADLVIHLIGQTGTLAAGNFI